MNPTFHLTFIVLGLAVYVSLIVGLVNTFCEGAIILLIDRLTNNYLIAVVVVVMVMVSPCESLLWYREHNCRQC